MASSARSAGLRWGGCSLRSVELRHRGAFQPERRLAAQYAQPVASGMTDNVAGALCYVLGLVTGIVFLVLAPYNQNKFVRFHAFQSIFFHVAFIGIWVLGDDPRDDDAVRPQRGDVDDSDF